MTAYDVRGLWLAAIIGAEALAVFVGPFWGIVSYACLLVLLVLGARLLRESPVHQFYLALGLVPFIRIVGLSLPLSDVSPVYSYLIMAVPTIIGVAAVAVALRMQPAAMGLTIRAVPLQLMVAALGAPIGVADYFILRPDPLIDDLTWSSVLVPALILLVATGIVENLAFRGVLQRAAETLQQGGWVIVAILFAALQMPQKNVWHLLLVLAIALLCGWVVKKTGSILGVSLSQGLASILVYLVFPFVFSA